MPDRLPFEARVPASEALMRRAATVLLVRDAETPGADGGAVEVFMLKRPATADFGGMMVFPGGKVDDTDAHAAIGEFCAGLDDASASRILGTGAGGLAYWVAAVRECFEECGVLLAYDTDGELLDLADPGDAARFQAYRGALARGHQAFFDLCHQEGMQLATDRMQYLAHWITPEGPPRRYDTRFFVTTMPPAQEGVHDDEELVDSMWVRPEDALAMARAGDIALIFPTRTTLEGLCGQADTASLLAHVQRGAHLPEHTPALAAEGMQAVAWPPG